MTMLVTGDQIRAARALLGWPAKTLSQKSGLAIATIQRLETGGTEIKNMTIQNYNSLVGTLQAAGIKFVQGDNSVGVIKHDE